MNGAEGGLQLNLDSFRLKFPLSIEAGGVSMIENGDTLMAAESLNASVKILPLLKGDAVIDEAVLLNGAYPRFNHVPNHQGR